VKKVTHILEIPFKVKVIFHFITISKSYFIERIIIVFLSH